MEGENPSFMNQAIMADYEFTPNELLLELERIEKNMGRIGCIVYGIIFSIASWIKLIWIYEPTYLQTRWPANLTFTLLGLGILIGILNLKSTRAYFGKNTVKIP